MLASETGPIESFSFRPSIHHLSILTPPPTLASCTRALTTAVHKGSICSSTALHARSSLICINRLLKISDPHVTSSPAQRPTPKACTWPFKASHLAQSTFVCSSLFRKAQIRPSAAQPSGIELTIPCSCSGYKLIVTLSALRSLRGRSVADACQPRELRCKFLWWRDLRKMMF